MLSKTEVKYKYRTYKGYIRIYFNRSNSMYEHRYIYEQFYNCCLLPYADIHHKNGIKTDNRIENLEPIWRKDHTKQHKTKIPLDTKCLLCGNNKTQMKRKKSTHTLRPSWIPYQNGHICNKCYMKEYHRKHKLT